jgi:hypothetical protein
LSGELSLQHQKQRFADISCFSFHLACHRKKQHVSVQSFHSIFPNPFVASIHSLQNHSLRNGRVKINLVFSLPQESLLVCSAGQEFWQFSNPDLTDDYNLLLNVQLSMNAV